MREALRHTRIVCTLGPATDAAPTLRRLIASGADVVRINAAHGSEAEHARRIARARQIARRLGRSVAVLLDLPGPKLRLGSLPGGTRQLRRHDEIVLTDAPVNDGDALPVDFDGFARHVRSGQHVALSDGSVRLRIARVDGRRVRCRVIIGGVVRSGSGVNLPESGLAIHIPTDDDRRWIRFACEHRVEWLGVSFVRTPTDLAAIRRRLASTPDAPLLMAKIEKRQALENLGGIIASADGVMVARGDLGVETPLAEVPIAQKRIIAVANEHGRPVVTATQMLESMVEDPSPTRAEVGDVANAVLDGTDAVMLSAETAIGRFPIRAVETLGEVIDATERRYPYGAGLDHAPERSSSSVETALAAQACRMSLELGAAAILVPSSDVRTIAAVARFRPRAWVLATSDAESRADALAMLWGVRMLRVVNVTNREARLREAFRWLRRRSIGAARRPLVALASSGRPDGPLDTLQVIRAPAGRV